MATETADSNVMKFLPFKTSIQNDKTKFTRKKSELQFCSGLKVIPKENIYVSIATIPKVS
jgi:hypothetical protein